MNLFARARQTSVRMSLLAIAAAMLLSAMSPFGPAGRALAQTGGTSSSEDLSGLNVGDFVTFGRYEQDNNLSNGPEPIEWIVVDTDVASLTLISRYALDAMPFNEKSSLVTWQICTLRQWLNVNFLFSAFTEAERARMPQTFVRAYSNPDIAAFSPGNDTSDTIYLASIQEIREWFPAEDARTARPTAHAIANGAWTYEDGSCRYWLRTPGHDMGNWRTYANVNGRGQIEYETLSSGYVCIRPMIVVNRFEEVQTPSAASTPIAWTAPQTTASPSEAPTQTAAQAPAPDPKTLIGIVTPSAGQARPDAKVSVSGLKAGDRVTFGRYEQDNNLSNGPEPIEWIVTAADGELVTLISRFLLDIKPFHGEVVWAAEHWTEGQDRAAAVPWSECDLHQWLNDGFVEEAFSEDELAMLSETLVPALDNPDSGTKAGSDVRDQVWLASIQDVRAWFKTDEARTAWLTPYAAAVRAEFSAGYIEPCNWWLRSPGSGGSNVAYVRYNGEVVAKGGWGYTFEGVAIRPVIALRALPGSKVSGPISDAPAATSAPPAVVDPDALRALKIGDVITFGRYEQNNNQADGPEALEWLVTETDGETVTAISLYALERKQFHENVLPVTWETCSLRAWLNDAFLNEAFTQAEQALIAVKTVPTSVRLSTGEDSAEDFQLVTKEPISKRDAIAAAERLPEDDELQDSFTLDRVWLPSLHEARTWFLTNDARKVRPTAYAITNPAFHYCYDPYHTTCKWWLRTMDEGDGQAFIVDTDGSAHSLVNIYGGCIRPVIVLQIP